MMQLEGLKWAELRYDFMLGFSAAMTGSSFDPFFALCAYITLKQLTAPPNTEVEIPFPEWPAYETKHSFIDQHHAANVALHVLQDLESAGRYHGTTTNIAAANEPLTWREIWPATCRSLACKPKEAISASGSVPSIDSAGLFVRNNFAAWNHALINDWERPQPKTSPWPTSPDIAFEDCWKKLIPHGENTTLNIEPLRESGYFGHRTLGELNTSIRAAIESMRDHSLLPKENAMAVAKRKFKEAAKQVKQAGSSAPDPASQNLLSSSGEATSLQPSESPHAQAQDFFHSDSSEDS